MRSGLRLVEQDTVAHMMGEHEAPASGQIRIGYLQIGILDGDIVVPRQPAAYVAVALLIVDGGHRMAASLRIVADGKQRGNRASAWGSDIAG